MHAPLFTVGSFPGGPFTISTTVKDYAAVRGRLGFALDRFLVFGTSGWVWGNPLTSYALTGAAPFVNDGGSSMGWTAGVGIDYAFAGSVFGRMLHEPRHCGILEHRDKFGRGAQSCADQRSASGPRVQVCRRSLIVKG